MISGIDGYWLDREWESRRQHASRPAIGRHGQCDSGKAVETKEASLSHAPVNRRNVKPGSTRKALLEVFAIEGGLSTGLQRTYVSRDCAYFKVDVEFQAVGRPNRDEAGRVTLVEDDQDIIVKISSPYLANSIMD